MNYLLDTHAILWWLDDNPKLSKLARVAISNPENLLFVSVVSIIEIRIKKRIGKLEGIPDNLEQIIENSQFSVLDFNLDHAKAIGGFAYYHKDPFDRLLISQTQIENLTLVTRDQNIMKYDINILKAL